MRVILFGQQFAALDDSEAMGFSAQGPGCLRTLASKLLAAGFAPERPLVLFRANQCIGRVSISAAAQG